MKDIIKNDPLIFVLVLLAALNGNMADLLIVLLIGITLAPSLNSIGEIVAERLRKALRRQGWLTD